MVRFTERLADLAGDLFLTSSSVTAVDRLSPQFVAVSLQADAFRRITSWTPGAKVQFRPRRGTLSSRTYTPVSWESTAGIIQLIAFVHGDGPGSTWFDRVGVNDVCEVLGPRRSLDLSGPSGPIVFVGDESSVALAAALSTVTPDVRHVFEAGDPAELSTVLSGLGLAEAADVVAKNEDRTALLALADAAGQRAGKPFDLVVTGDAATVHAVRGSSRSWASKPTSVEGKAYWAEGRVGLD